MPKLRFAAPVMVSLPPKPRAWKPETSSTDWMVIMSPLMLPLIASKSRSVSTPMAEVTVALWPLVPL